MLNLLIVKKLKSYKHTQKFYCHQSTMKFQVQNEPYTVSKINEVYFFGLILFALVLYQVMPFLFGLCVPLLSFNYPRLYGIICTISMCAIFIICVMKLQFQHNSDLLLCWLLSTATIIGQQRITYMIHGNVGYMLLYFFGVELVALVSWAFIFPIKNYTYLEWFTFVSAYSAIWICVQQFEMTSAAKVFAWTMCLAFAWTAIICGSMKLLLPENDTSNYNDSTGPRVPYELMFALAAAALVPLYTGATDNQWLTMYLLLLLVGLTITVAIAHYLHTQCERDLYKNNSTEMLLSSVPAHIWFTACLAWISIATCLFGTFFTHSYVYMALWVALVSFVILLCVLWYINPQLSTNKYLEDLCNDQKAYLVLMLALYAMAAWTVCVLVAHVAHVGIFYSPVCDSSSTTFKQANLEQANLTNYLANHVNKNESTPFNMALSIGFHNSYHQAGPFGSIVQQYGRSYPSLSQQLDLGFRDIEIDLHYDPVSDNFLVYHIEGLDARSSCKCLHQCIQQIQDWMAQHANHTPILLRIEPRGMHTGALWCNHASKRSITQKLIKKLYDAFNANLYTPNDLIGSSKWKNRTYTVIDAIHERGGWPTMHSLSGKILLTWNFFGETSHCRDIYMQEEIRATYHILFDRVAEDKGNSPETVAAGLCADKGSALLRSNNRYAAFMQCDISRSRFHKNSGFHTRTKDCSRPPMPHEEPYRHMLLSSSVEYDEPILNY